MGQGLGPTWAVWDLLVAEINETLQRLISSSRLIFSAADWLLEEREERSEQNVWEAFILYDQPLYHLSLTSAPGNH